MGCRRTVIAVPRNWGLDGRALLAHTRKRFWMVMSLNVDGSGKTMPRSPIYPGEILSDELEALGISHKSFAHDVEVPPQDLNQLMNGQHDMTEDISIRLGLWFGTSSQFWLNLQIAYGHRLAK